MYNKINKFIVFDNNNFVTKVFSSNHLTFNDQVSNPVTYDPSQSLAERLRSSTNSNAKSSRLSIDDELINFRRHRMLDSRLKDLIEALQLIQPTSVDNERAFSTCSIINSALRQSLSPENINSILFVNKFILTFGLLPYLKHLNKF